MPLCFFDRFKCMPGDVLRQQLSHHQSSLQRKFQSISKTWTRVSTVNTEPPHTLAGRRQRVRGCNSGVEWKLQTELRFNETFKLTALFLQNVSGPISALFSKQSTVFCRVMRKKLSSYKDTAMKDRLQKKQKTRCCARWAHYLSFRNKIFSISSGVCHHQYFFQSSRCYRSCTLFYVLFIQFDVRTFLVPQRPISGNRSTFRLFRAVKS